MSVIVEHVSKRYGAQLALDNVSFHVGEGEVVALLGPNGAGKSTMMKIIACYLPQTEGSVRVCGYDVATRPLEVKKHIGYLPENNPLYLDMYVREYLGFVAGLHKLGKKVKQRVDEMIGLCGLTPEAHKTIGKLSKGYRQRVGIAQALIHDPGVLILDEPTSGLDPNQLAEIRQLIREIGTRKTVILSTHILQEVEAVCNRVMIISKGRIVADAPTAEVRRLNKARKRVSVTFDKEVDPADLRALDGVADASRSDEGYWVFANAGEDIRPGIFRFAVEKGLVILSMEQQEESLEEVFRQMTL